MSLLINDELIWVSIPKNASHSIEKSLLNSNLNIKYYSAFYKFKKLYEFENISQVPHLHTKIEKLKEEFGNKETFCIKREFSDRFISAIEFIWDKIIYKNNHTSIIPINKIDNDFIYSFFTLEIINMIYDTSDNRNKLWFEIYCKLIKEELDFNSTKPNVHQSICTLLSQNFFTNGKKCTYEFDINNLNEYVLFVKNKFNADIKIEKLNANSNKSKSNIVNNNQFKNWLYNNFEKKFDINNKSII
jgi:hypothetical protein